MKKTKSKSLFNCQQQDEPANAHTSTAKVCFLLSDPNEKIDRWQKLYQQSLREYNNLRADQEMTASFVYFLECKYKRKEQHNSLINRS